MTDRDRDRDEAIIAAIRDWFDAFSRGDYDAAMETVHPDVVYVRPGGLEPLHGAAALRRWMEPDAFDSQIIEPVSITVDGDGDRVLVRQNARMRGAASGIEMEAESWVVVELDRGLVIRLEVFQLDQEAEARTAAGLAT